MDKKNERLKFVEIIRPTRIGAKAAPLGAILKVGDDEEISQKDASYLVGIKKAEKSDGKKASKGDDK